MPEAAADIGHNRPPLVEVLAEKHADLAAKVEGIADRANKAPRIVTSDEDLAIIGTLIVDARNLFKTADKEREAEKEPFLRGGREVDAFFKVHTDRLNRIGEAFRKLADTWTRQKAEDERRRLAAEAEKARQEAARQTEIAQRAAEANRTKTAEKHEAKAEDAQRAADEAAAAAASPAADHVRQRMDTGILATAKTEWAFEITDYDAIPLEKLRPYLKREHVEQAIRSLVKIQKNATPLPGVRIFEDVKSSFR